MENLKYLVTGTGKCGTLYLANLLTRVGMPCGHEAIFNEKGIEEALIRLNDKEKIKFSECSIKALKKEWTIPEDIVADSSYMSAPFLDLDILKNTKIIHLVRNPIDVISSFVLGELGGVYFSKESTDITKPFEDFIAKYCPLVYDNNYDSITRGAIFYIEWNSMIENKANKENYFFYKVENSVYKILNFLNKNEYNNLVIEKKINSWNLKNKKISLNDIHIDIRKNLIDVMVKYNYYNIFL